MKIIKYAGTDKFFAALMVDSGDSKYFLYGKANSPEIQIENSETGILFKNAEYLSTCNKTISYNIQGIPQGRNSKLFTILKIKDSSEFDTLYQLLETVYE